ncbi:substrate-binding periplasmic protein [Aeromonas allosaccharophila]|uniref:substrate-binding periplasmic protein n=1 Tax=Aeromonas allosaccharophila TaxID=656 RepID=UPI000DD078DA|nr:transporter substrate-binding domain-containing protein [Aeromonas allosaccharophila]
MRVSARILLFIALLLPATGGAAPAFTLRTCLENSDSYPWLLQSGEGIVQYHLKAVATALNAEIELTPLPWKRCLSQVSSGQMDAAIKMSYSVERATKVGVYPMRGGKPDPAKRLLTESYSLYQLKGGKSQWDGTTLRVKGMVAAQSGFSIVDLLLAAGAEVDDSSRDPLIMLKKLVMDRAQATAIQTEVADSILAAHPELQARIERLSPVLVEKPYYLVFSHHFYQAHPQQSRQVWDAIEQVRDSAAYQRYAASLRSTPPAGE